MPMKKVPPMRQNKVHNKKKCKKNANYLVNRLDASLLFLSQKKTPRIRDAAFKRDYLDSLPFLIPFFYSAVLWIAKVSEINDI